MTSGKDGPVRKLDGKGPVLVCRGERTFGESVECSPLPGAFRLHRETMTIKPLTQVERCPLRGACRCVMCSEGPGEEPGKLPEGRLRHNDGFLQSGDNSGRPVGSLCGVVALAGGRPVAFPDAGRVEVRGVAVDHLVREEGIEDGEAGLHQPGGLVVIGEVDCVEEVGTVAGVREDRFGEALPGEPDGDLFGPFEGSGVLFFGGGDPARPDRVEVDGEPSAADDVRVGGGGVTPGEALLDAVRPAGEKGRVHLIEGDIDAVHIIEGVQCLGPVGEGIEVGEVAAVDPAIAQGPEFNDCTAGKEKGEGPPDLFGVRGHARPPVQSGIAGKRGAETASPRATCWKLANGILKWPARVTMITARPEAWTVIWPSMTVVTMTAPPGWAVSSVRVRGTLCP